MFLSILCNAKIIAKHASPASKLCKLVKRILQKILRQYSRLGIDEPSHALTVHFDHEQVQEYQFDDAIFRQAVCALC
jgi:hypothetical protein